MFLAASVIEGLRGGMMNLKGLAIGISNLPLIDPQKR